MLGVGQLGAETPLSFSLRALVPPASKLPTWLSPQATGPWSGKQHSVIRSPIKKGGQPKLRKF